MTDQNDIQTTVKRYLHRLQIIHLALVAGMVLLGYLAYTLQKSPLADFPIGNQLFVYLVPLAALAGYFGGLAIFNKLMAPLDAKQDLNLRLMRFQSASLLHYTCLEAPALLAAFAYIHQGYLLYAAIAVFLIIYLIAQRPTLKKIHQKIPLTLAEKDIIVRITS